MNQARLGVISGEIVDQSEVYVCGFDLGTREARVLKGQRGTKKAPGFSLCHLATTNTQLRRATPGSSQKISALP